MSCLARSVLGLVFALLRRATVETLNRDDLTELMRLLRSLSMVIRQETTVSYDVSRLSNLLDQSGIFQTGKISVIDSQAAAEIAQAVMLRLSDDDIAGETQSQSQ